MATMAELCGCRRDNLLQVSVVSIETYLKRQRLLKRFRSDPDALHGALSYYSARPVEFVNDWIDTYDPRRASAKDQAVNVPFILFPRQVEMIGFVTACMEQGCNGLIEKSRDVGATWTCAALSVWLWLFRSGVSIGWGSRKAILVDRLNDPSSIFEKMRRIIESLPSEFKPRGLTRNKHLNYLRLVNPQNGSSIVGEAGDQIGRGGRTLIYFKDESAHYENPESIEAALSANTDCQIDISSVSGIGTVFHRRRENGVVYEAGAKLDPARTNVFIFDWRDHPHKDQAWYDSRYARAVADGLAHVHAQEVDRDYAAALPNTMVRREWIQAAYDLDKKLPAMRDGGYIAGLDVADEGGDLNALALRKGNTLIHLDQWARGDTGQTTRRVVDMLRDYTPVELQYDSTPVGSGVKSESNRLEAIGDLPEGIRFVPWNAGARVENPDDHVIERDYNSPLNKDFYLNLRAQAWTVFCNKLQKTWRHVHQGVEFAPDDMVAFSRDIDAGILYTLEKELCQVQQLLTHNMKQSIDKKPKGTRSPNLADAVIMAYFPLVGPGAYTSYIMRNIA